MITARDRNGKRIYVIDDNGKRNEEGFCPCCCKHLISKIGNGFRRAHWAHKSVERCDEWWEEENGWHIEWRESFVNRKSNFSVDIENVLIKGDKKHFYDVRIGNSLSIVLRRKNLSNELQQQYENFFENMVWVIGAKRTDYKRLNRQLETREIIDLKDRADCYYVCGELEESFFSKWYTCSAPVIFDFSEFSEASEKSLWVVLPYSKNCKSRYVINFSKDQVLDRVMENGWLFRKSLDEVLLDLDKKYTECNKNAIDIEFYEPAEITNDERDYCSAYQSDVQNADNSLDDVDNNIDYENEDAIMMSKSLYAQTADKSGIQSNMDNHRNENRHCNIFAGDSLLANYWNKK